MHADVQLQWDNPLFPSFRLMAQKLIKNTSVSNHTAQGP